MELERNWIDELGKIRRLSNVDIFVPKFDKGALIVRPVPSLNKKEISKELMEKYTKNCRYLDFNEQCKIFSDWFKVYHTVEFVNENKERATYILASVTEDKSFEEVEEEHPLFVFYNYLRNKNRKKLKSGVKEVEVNARLGLFGIFPAIVYYDCGKRYRFEPGTESNLVALKNTAVKSLIKELVNYFPNDVTDPSSGAFVTIASSQYFNESDDGFSRYTAKISRDNDELYDEIHPAKLYEKCNPILLDMDQIDEQIDDVKTYEFKKLVDCHVLDPEEVLKFLSIMDAPSNIVSRAETKCRLKEMKDRYTNEVLSKINRLEFEKPTQLNQNVNAEMMTDPNKLNEMINQVKTVMSSNPIDILGGRKAQSVEQNVMDQVADRNQQQHHQESIPQLPPDIQELLKKLSGSK
ncbi:MAG: hypothetical protein QXP60_02530 [Nitrososphaerota archaeon]